jgi:taurine dioxygenase
MRRGTVRHAAPEDTMSVASEQSPARGPEDGTGHIAGHTTGHIAGRIAGSLADRVPPGLAVRALSPALGAELRGLDLSGAVEPDTVRLMRSLLHEHCVLLLRGQVLDEAQQVRFGECFGRLGRTLGTFDILRNVHPSIMYVTNEKADGKYIGALPDGEMFFHSDTCYVEHPCVATMLYAIKVPSSGGDTRFANQYAAWDALPVETQRCIEGLSAMNTYEPGGTDNYAVPISQSRPTPKARAWAHPMVRTHPGTGRKALYVNRLMTEYVVGMPRAESDALLERLFDHQEQARFVHAHRWTPGDVLIWDNRCVLHARSDFDAGQARKLRRVTVDAEDALE